MHLVLTLLFLYLTLTFKPASFTYSDSDQRIEEKKNNNNLAFILCLLYSKPWTRCFTCILTLIVTTTLQGCLVFIAPLIYEAFFFFTIPGKPITSNIFIPLLCQLANSESWFSSDKDIEERLS